MNFIVTNVHCFAMIATTFKEEALRTDQGLCVGAHPLREL